MSTPRSVRRTARARTAILVAVVILVGACASPSGPLARSSATPAASAWPTPTSTGAPAVSSPSATAAPAISSPSPSAVAPISCARRVLDGLASAQRIGQLFLLGLADDRLGPAELSAIRDEHVGSVWFTAQTAIGLAGIRAIADAVQAQVDATTTGDVGFYVAANQEGGLIQALAGPGFSTVPSALVQGERSSAALTAEAQRWGQELRAAGVNSTSPRSLMWSRRAPTRPTGRSARSDANMATIQRRPAAMRQPSWQA